MVFQPFGSESSEPGSRIFGYALDHHDKVAPLHRIAFCLLVIFRQPEASGLQTLDIHHHPAILGMEQFHQLPTAAYEDEHVAVADIGAHLLLDHTDERVDAASCR